MNNYVRKEVKELINKLNLNCSVEKFKFEIDGDFIPNAKNNFLNTEGDFISNYEVSEDFLIEFQNEIGWNNIVSIKKLSGKFIRKYQNKFYWPVLSFAQPLSEQLIRDFKDKVEWESICRSQNLSENFMIEFYDKLDWNTISIFQNLSSDFINKFENKLNSYFICKYQKNAPELLKAKFSHLPFNYNWLHKTSEEKLNYIKENKLDELYELVNNEYLLAFKVIRKNYYSVYSLGYKYKINKTYESTCDCNSDNIDSFGLSAFTKNGAILYYPTGKLLLVKINIEDIGCFVRGSNKIRCRKLAAIKEIKK